MNTDIFYVFSQITSTGGYEAPRSFASIEEAREFIWLIGQGTCAILDEERNVVEYAFECNFKESTFKHRWIVNGEKCVGYLDDEFGTFSQYCRSQAGYYPGMSKKYRRELEIAAHKAGVKQTPRKYDPIEGRFRADWRGL
jgi:hypothetical protein